MGWEYLHLNPADTNCNSGATLPCCQTYNDYPDGVLSYYDPYFTDLNGNNLYDHDYTPGGHACYWDDPADTSEPINGLAFFSARGPTRDNRIKPEVTAPGVGIVATFSQDALAYELTLPVADAYHIRSNRVFADGLHSVMQGTSMACPHGTGSVALLLQVDSSLTPAEARDILQVTARVDGFTGTVPNNDWGYGDWKMVTATNFNKTSGKW
jgi:subtilisin family serine protease